MREFAKRSGKPSKVFGFSVADKLDSELVRGKRQDVVGIMFADAVGFSKLREVHMCVAALLTDLHFKLQLLCPPVSSSRLCSARRKSRFERHSPSYSHFASPPPPPFCRYAFIQTFLGRVGELVEAIDVESELRPVVMNTWGDGIFMAFRTARAAGDFALNLAKKMKETNWDAAGLPHAMSVRVGVHAGPAIALTDPLTGRKNLIGPHISHAARIEPITPSGEVCVRSLRPPEKKCTVPNSPLPPPHDARGATPPHRATPTLTPHSASYGSFQFAALLHLENSFDSSNASAASSSRPSDAAHAELPKRILTVECRYVGLTPFAKGYGSFALYHITWQKRETVSNEQRANLWKDSVKETKRALRAARVAAGGRTTAPAAGSVG